jgi:mono/diheme cytochrome c family protein
VPRVVLLLISFVFALPIVRADEAEAARLWTEGVQPLLDRNCVKCHGPLEQKSELELDNVAAVLKGSENGPVLVPGKPEESLIMEVFAPKSDPHMPPKKQLTDHEIAKVRTWIAALGQKREAGAGKGRTPGDSAGLDGSHRCDRSFPRCRVAGAWDHSGASLRRSHLCAPHLPGSSPDVFRRVRRQLHFWMIQLRTNVPRWSIDCSQAMSIRALFVRSGMHS